MFAALYNSKTKPNVIEKYSRKIFIGGLPLDAKENDFERQFRMYGPFVVDWNSRTEDNNFYNKISMKPQKNNGFAFLIFKDEECVFRFINEICFSRGDRYYAFFSTNSSRNKIIQVRPWKLGDAHYCKSLKEPINPRFTIFIGALPRQVKAVELAFVLERLYGRVVSVQIDWDTALGYPKGAARITFATYQSYVKALTGRYLEIANTNGTKKMEIKPYILDNIQCEDCNGIVCSGLPAIYFCTTCIQYYCEHCWNHLHYSPDNIIQNRYLHKPHQKLACMSK